MPFGIGLAAILMTAVASAQTGERPASAALIGSWVNANPLTATVTEIVVRGGDAGALVHLWAACRPSDCDWGEAGLVVPAGDVAAIAGALVQVLGDSRLATELGTEGRRRVESCFTAQQCAERVMSVFDSV